MAVAQVLVEAGAAVNWVAGDGGQTALHAAAKNGHAEVIRWLVSAQARPCSAVCLESGAGGGMCELHTLHYILHNSKS